MPRLGVRKLYHLLKEEFSSESIRIGRDRLFAIVRNAGLLVIKKKKYTRTTDSSHWLRRHPDLVKGTRVSRPEQVWVADITYLSTRQGPCYLHLVTDAYSKKIMGYQVSSDLSSANTLKALHQALKQRQYTESLIHHSDRGMQYCSSAYISVLIKNNIGISMTQDGSPYDNAIAERVNGILKDELGLDHVFDGLRQAIVQTRQAVTIYNHSRPHLSCSMLTPEQMHEQKTLEVKTWQRILPSLPH
jgi:putative transposase